LLIHCPSCRHAIRLVDVRPGRFDPTCPRCATSFRLIVPEEGKAPTVESIETTAEPPLASVEALPASTDEPEVGAPDDMGGAPRLGRLPRGVPRLLDGHIVLKLLGHGPRGKTLLARPLSLAKPVVLKLISADRSRDAVFVERHLREALAASKLSSPHLARIVEIGRDGRSVYTAAEYIPGATLAEEVARRGRVEPRLAASWILQAARGLADAHAQGIWHRDVKPENLRLDRGGLVVVDDLGLETTPSLAAAESRLDQAARKGPAGRAPGASRDAAPRIERAAVGTPSYMAPEQARDALVIDGRADVYSLGCVFYALVTGRPPYSKPTASELIAGHQDEAMIPPREFAPNIPPAIAGVIEAMTRKAPEERLPSMAAAVDALEDCLGLRTGAAEPEERAYREAIREASNLVNDAPEALLRRRILLGAGGAWLAFLLLLIVLGAFRPAVVVAGFGAFVGATLGFTSKLLKPAGLLDSTRELLLGDGIRSWLIVVIGLVVLLGLVVSGGLVGVLLFLGVCVGALIGAFHYYVERPSARILDEAASHVADSLRRLRRVGYDERLARWMLAAEAGSGWEPLFAAVFGERALEVERLRNARDASILDRLSWRGSAERLVSALLGMRRDTRLRRLFQEVEEARLEAEGLNLMTARRRSWRISRAIVLAAAEWRDEQLALQGAGASPSAAGPTLPQRLREAVEAPENVLEQRESHPGPIRRRFEALSTVAFGRTTRAALGAAMLAGLALWLHNHKIVTASQVGEAAAEVGRAARRAAESADPTQLQEIRVDIPVERSRLFQPLNVPGLPRPLSAIPAANLGAAGLLLLVASLFPARAVGFASLLAALVALLGHSWSLPGAWLDAATRAMLAGALILAVGIAAFRR